MSIVLRGNWRFDCPLILLILVQTKYCLRRLANPNPAKPRPMSVSVAGSGTALLRQAPSIYVNAQSVPTL